MSRTVWPRLGQRAHLARQRRENAALHRAISQRCRYVAAEVLEYARIELVHDDLDVGTVYGL